MMRTLTLALSQRARGERALTLTLSRTDNEENALTPALSQGARGGVGKTN